MHITIGRKSDFNKKELAETWEVRVKGGWPERLMVSVCVYVRGG